MVYIGNPPTTSVDPDKLPPSYAKCVPVGDNTEDLKLYFPENLIGAEGGPTSITAYLHTDSPIRPQIQSVLLSLKDQGPGWPYSLNEINNLNQKFIPP